MGIRFSCLLMNSCDSPVTPSTVDVLDRRRVQAVADILGVNTGRSHLTTLRKCYSVVRDDPRRIAIGMYQSWGFVLGLNISDFLESSLSNTFQQLLSLFEDPNACVCTYDETVNSFGAMLMVRSDLRRVFWYDSSEGVLLNSGDWTHEELLLIEKYDLATDADDDVLTAISDELVFALTSRVVTEEFFAFDADIDTRMYKTSGKNPFNVQWLKRFFS